MCVFLPPSEQLENNDSDNDSQREMQDDDVESPQKID